MKVNSRLIALMVAMAAGTAAAAGTTAGTAIQNVASATFTDPTTGNPVLTPVNSNPVYTTVNAIAAFDIVYTDSSPDGTTASTPAATYDKLGVLPGANVDTAYTVVNNGNVNNYVVNLTSDTTGTANAPTSVAYYLATDTAFATPITSVTVPNGGEVKIVQRIVIPTSAVSATTYSASPIGTAPAGSITTIIPADGTNPAQTINTLYGAVNEVDNVNAPATTPTNRDLEFTRATIFTPLVNVVPPSSDPTTPVTTDPLANVVVPPTGPTGTPVTDPNNPVSPPNTTGAPSDPSTPGYVDPANPGTSITSDPTGDQQIAYPPADGDATADKVTFVNTVTNTGIADVVNLFPTDSTGAPIGVNNLDGSFTLSDGTIVKFLNPDGTPATLVNGYPTISVLAGTPTTPSTANFQTQVTYPDSNSVANPAPITILVGIDSSNDFGVIADGTTTNIIMPPAMQFGDATTALGTDPAPLITQVVSPKAAQPTGAGIITSPNTTDAAAVFPMDIVNQGEYGDSYTLTTPVVTFPNTAGGTTPAVSVKYVDSTGAELPKNAAGNYITPVVAKNEEYKVFLVVVVPDDAAAGSVTVPQTATGNYSTIVATDPNDVVQIAVVNTNPDPITGNPTSGIDVDKYQTVDTAADPAVVAAPVPTAAEKNTVNALPGDTIRYAIVAKNNFNTPVANFILSDSASGSTNVYTFSNFVSATATTTGFVVDTTAPFTPFSVLSATVFYKVNGGAFSTTAPAAGTVITSLEVAVDTNGDNAITAADVVPALGSIRLDIAVTVK